MTEIFDFLILVNESQLVKTTLDLSTTNKENKNFAN